MTDFVSKYFGPLSKDSCVYFLIISSIFFVMMVTFVFINMFWLIKNYKQANFRLFTGGVVMFFNIFLAYFVNRLLYTMCTKSLA